MTYSSFFGLELAVRALSAQQGALGVAGHNISNAGTAGYSRQVADIRTAIPMTVPGSGKELTLGTGSILDTVSRARDAFIDRQYRTETAKYEYWAGRQSTLRTIEGMMNEPSQYSLSNDLSHFWNAWSVLANNPQNTGARSALLEQTLTMVDTFHHLNQQITDMQQELDSSVTAMVNQINTIAKQLRELNIQIKNAEVAKNNPNDLRDQRDALVDQLAKLVPVRVIETQDPAFSDRVVGLYKVVIGNPNDSQNVLVDDQHVRTLTTTIYNGFQQVVWADHLEPVTNLGLPVNTPIEIKDGDQIRINVDGTSYTIDLSTLKGEYNATGAPEFTFDGLAQKLEGAINAAISAKLGADAPTVEVKYEDNRFTIASTLEGPDSRIAFEAISGSFGRTFTEAITLNPEGGYGGAANVTVLGGIYNGNGNTLRATYVAATQALMTGNILNGTVDFTDSTMVLRLDGGVEVTLDLGSLVNSATDDATYDLSDPEQRDEFIAALQALIDNEADLNGKLEVNLTSDNRIVLANVSANSGTSSVLEVEVTGSASKLGLSGSASGADSYWQISDNDIPPNTAMVNDVTEPVMIPGLTLEITEAADLADGDSFTLDLTIKDRMADLGFTTEVVSNAVDLGIDEGKLAANLEMRDSYLEQFRSKINTLVKGIADAVNALHYRGQGLQLETTGLAFFTSTDGSPINAANIALNPLLQNDPSRVATGLKTDPVEKGDSSIALAIASLANDWTRLQDLINQDVFGPDGTPPVHASSFADYYGSLITDLGVNAQQAVRMSEGQAVLVNQMYIQRENISGVSLDEEMTNLIKHQKSYMSAARLVTILDSMLENVLNMGITR